MVLRTHTSPVQIRVMESQPPPIYTVMPGPGVPAGHARRHATCRCSTRSRGWSIDRGITFGDLAGTIEAFTKAYFGGEFASRLRPSYFPFTEPSAEFDIQRPDGSWLELGGCGMVHPNVLRSCGIDPEEWSGLRLRLRHRPPRRSMRHGIDDLREMFTNDIRFLEQF